MFHFLPPVYGWRQTTARTAACRDCLWGVVGPSCPTCVCVVTIRRSYSTVAVQYQNINIFLTIMLKQLTFPTFAVYFFYYSAVTGVAQNILVSPINLLLKKQFISKMIIFRLLASRCYCCNHGSKLFVIVSPLWKSPLVFRQIFSNANNTVYTFFIR